MKKCFLTMLAVLLLGSNCSATKKSSEDSSALAGNNKITATCLLEGGVWMQAPTCLPLNSDGKSVSYQGQRCTTIAMCGAGEKSGKTATCLLEGGVWMRAPTCLPLNSDGKSVSYQGQRCTTIAMCP